MLYSILAKFIYQVTAEQAIEVMIMLRTHYLHFFKKHTQHLHPDWILLGALALAQAIIAAINQLELRTPFLASPEIL